jgi:hypothetical protein
MPGNGPKLEREDIDSLLDFVYDHAWQWAKT